MAPRTSIEKGAPSPLGARQGVPLFISREGHFLQELLLKAPWSRKGSQFVGKVIKTRVWKREKVDPTSRKSVERKRRGIPVGRTASEKCDYHLKLTIMRLHDSGAKPAIPYRAPRACKNTKCPSLSALSGKGGGFFFSCNIHRKRD